MRADLIASTPVAQFPEEEPKQAMAVQYDALNLAGGCTTISPSHAMTVYGASIQDDGAVRYLETPPPR